MHKAYGSSWMTSHKVISLIGFANKAGKTALGRTAALHKKNIHLLVLATDASQKLVNELKQSLGPLPPIVYAADKNRLGQICGREQLAVIGICDPEFARAIRGHLQTEK